MKQLWTIIIEVGLISTRDFDVLSLSTDSYTNGSGLFIRLAALPCWVCVYG